MPNCRVVANGASNLRYNHSNSKPKMPPKRAADGDTPDIPSSVNRATHRALLHSMDQLLEVLYKDSAFSRPIL